jgi:hypothetical protein
MEKRNSRFGEWIARAALVVPGFAMIALGVLALQQDISWEKRFSERFGRFEITPTLNWIVLGVIFSVIGFVPWNRISNWLDKRDAKKRRRY